MRLRKLLAEGGPKLPTGSFAAVLCSGSTRFAMPIRLLLEHDHAFTPEEVEVLIDAFEDTLRTLKLVNRQDPLTLAVAKIIIESAKEGERDPIRLRDLALKNRSRKKALS